jgi:hypothetical protein
LIILLILSACSSIKIPECPQAKIDADNQLRFASQLESTKDYSAAGESYNFLLNSYRSFADGKRDAELFKWFGSDCTGRKR